MNFKNLLSILLIFLILVTYTEYSKANRIPCTNCDRTSISNTDYDPFQLYAYFDLRDRESFFQITNVNNPDSEFFNLDITVHVQIFNVDQNCNENDFFDELTPNDTHVYNLRDILTNDGNPSGVVLPVNAYGIVVVSLVSGVGGEIIVEPEGSSLVGNFRIIDDSGYEYRTNAAGVSDLFAQEGLENIPNNEYTFNFNTQGGVILSDVVGIRVDNIAPGGPGIDVSDITENFGAFDIDIYDLNETPFSCRNIIFSCVDQDNPRLQELLEVSGLASVASFEYGINNAIPHSKDGELLCPGNIISDGFVTLTSIGNDIRSNRRFFVGYVGLNNGNGRGSMDSFWSPSNLFGGM